MSEYGMIALILGLSTLIGALFKRLQLPAVVGQLLVGIILGPALLNWIHESETLHFLAEIGVLVLMFLAGLESDLDLLKRYIKPSVLVAVMGVIVPITVFYYTSQFWYNSLESLFIGIVFSATSVSITVGVLQEYGKLKSKEGATILGAAVVDDILAVLILSFFISAFTSSGSATGALWLSLVLQLLFMAFILVLTRYLVVPYMHFFERLPIYAGRTLGAVILFLVMAELAKQVGLSDVIGTFFAGVAVGQTNKETRAIVENKLSGLGYAFFIPLFFASIGLELTLAVLGETWPIILVFLLVAILTKLVGCGLAAKLCGFDLSASLSIGSGMVSRGEMALIVAQIGYAQHLVDKTVYSILVVAIILSTLAAPFLLKASFKK
ncbi:cation:proton antiporter [Streptococcus dentiloxodontae]